MFFGSLQATRAMCATPSVMVIGTRTPSVCAFPREERCCTGITCVQKRLPILITNLENKTEHSQHPEIHSTRKRIAIDTANTTECLPRARRRSPTIAHCQEWFSALVRRHNILDFFPVRTCARGKGWNAFGALTVNKHLECTNPIGHFLMIL